MECELSDAGMDHVLPKIGLNSTKDEITRLKSKVYEQRPFGRKQWAEVDSLNRLIQEVEKGKK